MRKLLLVCFVPVLLFCSACGISQSDYDAAVSAAYDEGYSDGYNDGEDDGYDNGFSAGKSKGMSDGYEDGYKDGLLEHQQERVFFRNNACIVTITGSRYHHYGCYHIEGQRYYIYNIELAQYRGYTPCLDCWEDGLMSSLVLPDAKTD